MIPVYIAAFAGALLALLSSVSCYFTIKHNMAYSYELPKTKVSLYSLFLSLLTAYAAACFIAAGYLVFYRASGAAVIIPIIISAVFSAALFLSVFFYGRSARALTDKRHSDMLEIVRSLESKDLYTKGHSVHVYKITGLIYELLPRHVRNRIRKIKLMDAALLHDVGKIRIPDDIINKSGRLDDREYLIMTQHARNGSDMLEGTQYNLICPYILYHHERPDGKGYYKLKGGNIPLESRIIAVADTFSALYSDRSYRKKLPFDKAMKIVTEAAGTQLDAAVVSLFSGISQQRLDELDPAVI